MVRLVPPWARPRLGRLPGDPEPEQALIVPGAVEAEPERRTVNAIRAEAGLEPCLEHLLPEPDPELPEGVLGYGVGLWVDGEFLGLTHVTALSRESAEDEVRCWQREQRVCRVVEVRLP